VEAVAERAAPEIDNEAWVLDDTGFPKDGKDSPGVKRQYSGALRKTGNCQIGVSVHAVDARRTRPVGLGAVLAGGLVRGPGAAAQGEDSRYVLEAAHRRQTATDRDTAWEQLERFAETWDHKYPTISIAWTENWERIVPFLAFPPDARSIPRMKVSKGPRSILGLFRVLRRSGVGCARGRSAAWMPAKPGRTAWVAVSWLAGWLTDWRTRGCSPR
jgi:hypothetical protein